MPSAGRAELVFVVDVSSFSKDGFVGTSTYEGKEVDLEFDDRGDGVFLTSEMARRLRAKKGSSLSITLEAESNQAIDAALAGVSGRPKISDAKVYYGIGKEGGAVIRIRKT